MECFECYNYVENYLTWRQCCSTAFHSIILDDFSLAGLVEFLSVSYALKQEQWRRIFLLILLTRARKPRLVNPWFIAFTNDFRARPSYVPKYSSQVSAHGRLFLVLSAKIGFKNCVYISVCVCVFVYLFEYLHSLRVLASERAVSITNKIMIIIIISYLYRLNLFSNSVLLSIKDLFKTYINYKRKNSNIQTR